MSEAADYLANHMDSEDAEVEVYRQRSNGEMFFKRLLSGHLVDPGWSAIQRGLKLQRIPDTPLTLQWLKVHHGQGLEDQIRFSNIYYVVDGLVNNKQIFHTSLHGFLSPKSAAMVEYTRLIDIAKTMREIEAGEAAKMRMTRLLAAAPNPPQLT